ncbi:hypothetical protein ACKI1K_43470 [Streptomyces scabiei]|uniref:hypothetical protein n=1 Tax=Streptomyces scabiei TaxID=1930 RepID=UPI0038F73593
MNANTGRRNFIADEYRGLSKDPTYRSWYNLVRRYHFGQEMRLVQTGPNTAGFANVPVCSEWVNDFGRFLDEIGAKPSTFHVLTLKPGATEWNRRTVTWEFRPPVTEARRNLFFQVLIETVVFALVISSEQKTFNDFCSAEMVDEIHGAYCDCDW